MLISTIQFGYPTQFKISNVITEKTIESSKLLDFPIVFVFLAE